jgi:hypothetical protein
MGYNPSYPAPYDNPRAIWCEYCGDQITEDQDIVNLVNDLIVHKDCLEDYTNGLLFRINNLEEKIEKLVELGN